MRVHQLILPIFLVTAAGFTVANDPWPVPDKYVKMPNPVKSDQESLAAGKELWIKHCQSCHGKSGKGDGPKAAQLKTLPEELTKPDILKQTDGAFFYKTSEGRNDMPSFKKKIPDQDDIWSIVNYIRTFKK
jgi:mono/diheme cytochrome c family protein